MHLLGDSSESPVAPAFAVRTSKGRNGAVNVGI
jgi:hypothetical protein